MEEEALGILVYKPKLPPVRLPEKERDSSKLVFRDEVDRLMRLEKCKTGVSEECLEGARMGCSLKAAKKCRVPWVLKLLGLREDIWSERDACQTENIKKCMEYTKVDCTTHASNFCTMAFQDKQ